MIRSSFAPALALAACLLATSAVAEVEFGVIAEDFTYEEPGLMEETGQLAGLYFRAEKITQDQWGGELVGNWRTGSLDYDGQTWGGDPITAETDDRIWQLQANVGYEFRENWTTMLVYSGLGRRSWDQELSGAGGYAREIDWYYLPIGARIRGPFGSNWEWSLRLEGQQVFAGTVTSRLSEASPSLSDVENAVDDGTGFLVALGFRYELERNGGELRQIAITPYYQTWDVERSNFQILYNNGAPDGLVYEPANDTREIGVRLSLIY